MEIAKNIRIVDCALYLIKEKTLIISDLHLGFEESLNKQGYFIPRFQFKDIKEKIKLMLESLQVNEVVFNGDLKHEFGSISTTEWNNIISLLEFISFYCKSVVIIKGNHDVLLEPIAKKIAIKVHDYHKVGECFISHGDKVIDNLDFSASKTVIIGNEHTAISIRKSGRKEVYKCFLLGKFEGKKLIAMPSFNPLVEGTDVLNEDHLSPFLKQDLSNFDVYVVADETYHFGRVKDVENL